MIARWFEALSALLPTGFAWPRHPRSVLMRVLWGWAALLDELDRFTTATAAQWTPHTTTLRLAEWEAACGLPDGCFGEGQSTTLRRRLLLTRLRGVQLPLADASNAAPGVLQAICAELGYEVIVTYNTPFRVARDRVGSRLGALNGVLHVHVVTSAEPFRVGANRSGDRLMRVGSDLFPLYCLLRKWAPARYDVRVNFLSKQPALYT